MDWEGAQYWTDPIDIIPHEVNEIDMDLDLLGLNLTRDRLYANNKPKNVLLALVGFPYRFFVSSVIAAPGVSEKIYYYHNDHLGTPQVLTNDNGEVIWNADYKPFGEADVVTEEVNNNFRFPGQYFEQETGFHYNYYRYYDSNIGRYLRPDPLFEEIFGIQIPLNLVVINVYIYSENNPIRNIDPFGLLCFATFDAPGSMGTLKVYRKDECPDQPKLVASYPAGNYVTKPGGDPNQPNSRGPIPRGTYPMKKYRYKGNDPRTGPYFFPIRIPTRPDIGIHGGRTGPKYKTWGCIRLSNSSIMDLKRVYDECGGITHITIK